MRVNRAVQDIAFQPFYSSELGAYVRTSRQEGKLLKEKGLAYMSDYKKLGQKAKQERKHKHEIIAESYAKENLKYPKGQDVRFDEKHGEFVRTTGERVGRKVFISVAGFLLITSLAFARIEGVEYAKVKVEGKVYDFPIGNKERKQDVYYLLKAMNGDKEAREVFLGGEKERYFFIGDETPLWLVVDTKSEKVIDPT